MVIPNGIDRTIMAELPEEELGRLGGQAQPEGDGDREGRCAERDGSRGEQAIVG